MSHSFVSNLMHCTFSTKERYPFIDSKLESRLWPYIGGIADENRLKPLAIGGTRDHLPALLSLPGMMSFAKAVQLIKGGSSKWIHDTFENQKKFAWQEGYGALSQLRLSSLAVSLSSDYNHTRKPKLRQSSTKNHSLETYCEENQLRPHFNSADCWFRLDRSLAEALS